MKTSQIIGLALGLGIIGLGAVMAATNPDEAAFEKFALEQVQTHGCKEVPQIVRERCPEFVHDNQAQVKKLIMQDTRRENYGLFSIYHTNLTARSILPELPLFLDLPAFKLETVAMFGKFYIYETKKQKPSLTP